MVLEFLKAELDSSRFGALYPQMIGGYATRALATSQDGSEIATALRLCVLTMVRGYANRTLLFDGFPTDVTWWRADLLSDDLNNLMHVRDPAFVASSRLVRESANSYASSFNKVDATAIEEMAEKYRSGAPLARPIVAADHGRLVVIEGNLRAIAYIVADVDGPYPIILGRSPAMSIWPRF
jgi:hypothetical protein